MTAISSSQRSSRTAPASTNVHNGGYVRAHSVSGASAEIVLREQFLQPFQAQVYRAVARRVVKMASQTSSTLWNLYLHGRYEGAP